MEIVRCGAQLRGLWSIDAGPELTVFLLARLLEVQARDLCAKLLGAASFNMFSNVESLRHSGLVSESEALALHCVRRLGNEARHGLRELTVLDQDLCISCTADGLQVLLRGQSGHPLCPGDASDPWTDLQKLLGDRIRASDGSASQIRSPASLNHATVLLEQLQGQPAAELALLEWISLNADASALLQASQPMTMRYPDISRFFQLNAVALSRLGLLDEAERVLRGVGSMGDIIESQGILGGILKRRWRGSGARADLRRAAKCYLHAWRDSALTNTYAGINLAAVTLWLGLPRRSRSIASQVMAVIDRAQNCRGDVSPWLDLTRLEALVLLGEFEQAACARSRLQDRKVPQPLLDIADEQIATHRMFMQGA